MRGKAKKQSKFMGCLGSPVTILRKGRDLYMNCLFNCAGKTGCSSVVCPTPQYLLQLPGNLGVSSSNELNNEDLRELVRVVSKRRHAGSKVEMIVDRQQEEVRPAGGASTGVGRSYSVGVGRIGRIDEDKPCEFEEEDVQANSSDLLCPRSRSYAVRRRNIVYY